MIDINRYLRFIILAFCFFLFNGQTTWGQAKMTKIKDGTIAGSSTEPFEGSVLELESKAKGFLLPRMTTADRDAIPAARKINGLIVFNTTTNCINYWVETTSTWLSICGTPPPAVMTLSNCDNIKVSGVLKEGENLDANNFLEIPVTVSQAGTYDLVVSTDNGYYFSVSGTFPNTGNYTLYLPGAGKPRKGYPIGVDGDKLKITLQGTPSTDCDAYAFVENANVGFVSSCEQILSEGTYMLGLPLDASHKISMKVNVTTIGNWSAWTHVVNGYSFRGEGVFTSLGDHIITLQGEGTPFNNIPVVDEFIVFTNSDVESDTECVKVNVSLAQVAYTIDCAAAVINGQYLQDEPLNQQHTIDLPIFVTNTGDIVDIKATGADGITYSSGPLALRTIGAQVVILRGSGTPNKSGDLQLTISGDPVGGSTSCQVTVPVKAQPVDYTMSCNSIQVMGNYAPNIPMTASNFIQVKVNVSYPGDWTMSTNTVNGVSFSGSGTFTGTGEQTVTLVATGKGTGDGLYSYKISMNSASSSTECSTDIKFIYRKMNILGIGGSSYVPNGSGNYTATVIPNTASNFGPNGVVKMEGFNFFRIAAGASATTISNAINNNNIDIIVTGYNATPNAAATDVLSDFVLNKKGVLIVAQENGASTLQGLITKIAGGNVVVESYSANQYPIASVNDPVLVGPFGDMKGKNMGGDRVSNYSFSNLPATMIGLASHNERSDHYLVKHKTLGFMACGDAGVFVGGTTRGNADSYPARITGTGAPGIQESYSSFGGAYNSFIYANALAWAVKYVQENTLDAYQIPANLSIE